jgi:hypothetical protein
MEQLAFFHGQNHPAFTPRSDNPVPQQPYVSKYDLNIRHLDWDT